MCNSPLSQVHYHIVLLTTKQQLRALRPMTRRPGPLPPGGDLRSALDSPMLCRDQLVGLAHWVRRRVDPSRWCRFRQQAPAAPCWRPSCIGRSVLADELGGGPSSTVPSPAITSMVRKCLCGSLAMTPRPLQNSSSVIRSSIHYWSSSREANATSSRANPFWASPAPGRPPDPRRPRESHTTKRGQPRCESDSPGA